MRQLIKEYFSFTKKERVAVVSLVGVILAAYFLPMFIRTESKAPTAKEMAELKAVKQDEIIEKPYTAPADRSPPARMFYFDPNTVSAEGWEKLGLRAKTIGTILKYLSKGGHFYKVDDLKKIYGLHAADYERLGPYVRIDKPQPRHSGMKSDTSFAYKPLTYKPPAYKKPLPKIIDVNQADTSAFIALPGIGAKLAARIISFREKLGGFYSIEQIAETYGLPDSAFQAIRPFLALAQSQPRKFNLNTTTLETFRQHPYIRWGIANAIIRYREQHGPFKSLQELQQIAAITPEVYKKIVPYLTLSE